MMSDARASPDVVRTLICISACNRGCCCNPSVSSCVRVSDTDVPEQFQSDKVFSNIVVPFCVNVMYISAISDVSKGSVNSNVGVVPLIMLSPS